MSGNACDVYAHFWWDDSYKGKVNRLHFSERFDPIENPIETFKSLYSPKKIIYEPCVAFDTQGLSLDWTSPVHDPIDDKSVYMRMLTPFKRYALYSKHVSMKHSLDLVENPAQYDVIVILRSDLLLFRTGTLSSELPSIPTSRLYIPSSLHGGPMFAGEHPNRIAEWYFLGSYESIRKFINTSLNCVTNDKVIPVHNQERYLFFSKHSDIPIDMFNSSISIRRFPTEEWEDVSYCNKHAIESSVYVELFDDDKKRMKPSDLLPFYTSCIGF